MSLGKMNTFIDIFHFKNSTDDAGFNISEEVIIASVRAYKEDRYGSKTWASRAAFSNATCLFRFRVISDVDITTDLRIKCNNKIYKILNAEDVRGRGMYIEVLAEHIQPSK